MITSKFNIPLHKLLAEAGCKLPPGAKDLMVADQAHRLIENPAWLVGDATNAFQNLCQLFDPNVQLAATEHADQPVPLVGKGHEKGLFLGVLPKVRCSALKIWWKDTSLIPHARLLGDIVRIVLACTREPEMGKSSFQMSWVDRPGWTLAAPTGFSIPVPEGIAGECCHLSHREHLALAALDPISGAPPLTIGARCLRFLQASLGRPYTNPAVADICWSREEVADYHDHSRWTFRALRPTHALAVAVRILGDGSLRPELTEMNIRCNTDGVTLVRHPEWPEIVILTSSHEWPAGSQLQLSVNASSDQVQIYPNPIVLEPDLTAEFEGPNDFQTTMQKWNLVASPTSLQEYPLQTQPISDRWFIRASSNISVSAGHLVACLQRRFVLAHILNAYPVGKIVQRSSGSELLHGLAVEIEHSNIHHIQRTAEAVRRATEGLIPSNQSQKGFVHVQTKS
ncbi:MAG: hypothetical protein CME32_07310 [Gimesia sp.]|nr:hypothetical protein [Gimesia sp.]